MPALSEISENKRYTYGVGDNTSVVSGRSHQSAASRGTSRATSGAYSTTSRVHRYLSEAISTTQLVNSQFSSAGDQYSPEEIRTDLLRVCEQAVTVSARADEYSAHSLEFLANELQTLEEFLGSLPENVKKQLAYNLKCVVGIKDQLREVATAKTATASEFGSQGGRASLQQLQQAVTASLASTLQSTFSEVLKRIDKLEDGCTTVKAVEEDTNEAAPSSQAVAAPVEEIETVQMALDGHTACGQIVRQPAWFRPTDMQPHTATPGGQQVIWLHPNMANGDQKHLAPLHSHGIPTTNGAHNGSNLPAYMIPNVTVNTHVTSDANATSDAKQDSSLMSTVVSTMKTKVKAAMGNPLLTALVGFGAAILLHNHTPILKHVGRGADRRRIKDELEATKREHKRAVRTGLDAVEDCYDSMREWREHSRRAKNPFDRFREPDSSKCDLRQIRRRLEQTIARGPDDEDESWRVV